MKRFKTRLPFLDFLGSLKTHGLFGLVLFTFPFVACSSQHSHGQEAITAESPPVASTVADEVDIAALETYIEQARQDWDVPGLSVTIVHNDETLLCRGFGTRKAGSEVEVNADTLFAIASNTKAFTSALLAILVDEGKLSWDDSVDRYLPWLRLKDPMARDLRIRDLLCHRSGLGTFSGDLVWWGTKYSPREVLERAVHLEPATPFRAGYGYSNLMFLAAGLVIEEVEQKPWSEVLSLRILKPLKMSRTISSTQDLANVSNVATPHKTTSNGNLPLEWMNWDNMAAAGGIISSGQDMSQWLKLQLRHGAFSMENSREKIATSSTGQDVFPSHLFSKSQSLTMWQAHTPLRVSESYRATYPSTHFRAYGLGWALADYQGRKMVSHGGGYDGMYSQVALIPEEGLGIAVLTNSMTGVSPAITYRILDAFLGAEERDWSAEKLPEFRKSRKSFNARIEAAVAAKTEGTSPSHELNAYTGEYRCPLYGDAKVTMEDNTLTLRLLPNEQLVGRLEHLHYDTFVIRWNREFAWFGAGTANFLASDKGAVDRIELNVPNDDMWFYEVNLRRQE